MAKLRSVEQTKTCSSMYFFSFLFFSILFSQMYWLFLVVRQTFSSYECFWFFYFQSPHQNRNSVIILIHFALCLLDSSLIFFGFCRCIYCDQCNDVWRWKWQHCKYSSLKIRIEYTLRLLCKLSSRNIPSSSFLSVHSLILILNDLMHPIRWTGYSDCLYWFIYIYIFRCLHKKS